MNNKVEVAYCIQTYKAVNLGDTVWDGSFEYSSKWKMCK